MSSFDFDTFYADEQPRLMAFCWSFIDDRDQAMDATQEVWIRFLLARARFYNPEYPPARMLVGEAKRYLIDQHRYKRRRAARQQICHLDATWEDESHQTPLWWIDLSSGSDWMRDVEDRIDLEQVMALAGPRLTALQRDALRLDALGYNGAEAAREEGITRGAHILRLFRARDVLRQSAREIERGPG